MKEAASLKVRNVMLTSYQIGYQKRMRNAKAVCLRGGAD
jgi:hypothetical protein